MYTLLNLALNRLKLYFHDLAKMDLLFQKFNMTFKHGGRRVTWCDKLGKAVLFWAVSLRWTQHVDFEKKNSGPCTFNVRLYIRRKIIFLCGCAALLEL
jgi:hypothetical protein